MRTRDGRDVVLRALHLCSGYGGFELALRYAGIDARTVAHVERDSYAAATLVARMGESRLDQAPVWSDLFTFDAAAWRGRVDLITAGFPCQPFSTAGKRQGIDDERHIWPRIADIISDVRPRYVLLENVRGVVRAILPHVLADLAGLGFDAEWGLLSASAVGGPHKRERWWCLADADRGGPQGIGQRCKGDSGRLERHADRRSGTHVADTASEHVREPDDQERAESRQRARPHVGRDECHQWPPRPDDRDGWEQWTGAQPSIRRSADGATEWLADALHLGGNGLVPQCAAEAFRQLAARAGIYTNDDEGETRWTTDAVNKQRPRRSTTSPPSCAGVRSRGAQ